MCRNEVTAAASGSVRPRKMFFFGALTVTPLVVGHAAGFAAATPPTALGYSRLACPRNPPELDFEMNGLLESGLRREGEAPTADRNKKR